MRSFNRFCREAGGALQAVQAQILFLLAAHHRDVDLGISHVGREFDERDRDILHPRIAQFRQDRHADDFANGRGGFQRATRTHRGFYLPRRERGSRRELGGP